MMQQAMLCSDAVGGQSRADLSWFLGPQLRTHLSPLHQCHCCIQSPSDTTCRNILLPASSSIHRIYAPSSVPDPHSHATSGNSLKHPFMYCQLTMFDTTLAWLPHGSSSFFMMLIVFLSPACRNIESFRTMNVWIRGAPFGLMLLSLGAHIQGKECYITFTNILLPIMVNRKWI